MNDDWKIDMLRQMWTGKEIDPEKDNKGKASSKKSLSKKAEWPSIDLHKYDQLSQQLESTESAIDRAISNGHNGLVIIHGKGQGILKTEIIKLLKNHHQIAEFKSVKDSLNESGVIRVRFK